MSAKRLNKRQLREQQELEELAKQGSGGVGTPEEKEGTTAVVVEQGSAEEEGDDPASKKTGASIFAQLAEEGPASEPEEESVDDITTTAISSKAGKKNKKKKKKKKAAGASTNEASANAVEDVDASNATERTEEISAKSSKRKPRKSNKISATASKSKDQPKDMSNMSMDEFSALLASQAKIDAKKAEENGQTALATVTPVGPLSSLRALLALSPPALDPAVELKRQFGAAAIKAYEAEAGQQGGGAQSASAGARARAQAWNSNFKVRNILVQPKETWPPIARTFTGMTMDVMEAQGRGKVGGWVHSRAYRRAQYQFLQAVHSYEPNQLMALLQMYPWHIDSLLQLSDVSRHQGDLGQASDFNARALFAFERTAAPIFTSSLTSHLGPPMLNFRRVEDRGFWLAAHRHVNFLGRRGTWRTALEWVKLILGLDPPRDPHGMLLWLDFLSIKSRQHDWFLGCFDRLEAALAQDQEQSDGVIIHGTTPFNADLSRFSNVEEGKGSLNWCLGLMYARALALRAVEREEKREGKQEDGGEEMAKSTAALRFAIALHPHVLPALFEKIGVALPAGVSAAHPFFESNRGGDTLAEILAHIYVARSESLWRDGDTGAWLAKTLKDAWPALTKAFENDKIHRPSCTAYAYQEGIWRHVLVSDLPDALRQKLVGLIPQSVTQDSSNLDSYDPLPPLGPETTTYDDEYFAAMQARRGGNDEHDYVDLSADSAAGMMDRLMLAFRNLRGNGGGAAGGGGAEWEAAMQGMDDETRQDVMAQMMDIAAQAQNAAGGGGEAAGRMPGALGVEHADDRDGNEEANGPGRFAALRGFLDRVWGGNEVQNDTSNNDDDDDEEEDGDEDWEAVSDEGVD